MDTYVPGAFPVHTQNIVFKCNEKRAEQYMRNYNIPHLKAIGTGHSYT